MIEIILLVMLALLLLTFKVFKFGNYFSPWFITAGVWFAILFMYQFQNDVLYPLSDKFYTCLSLWVPIFCVASLITYYVLPSVGHEDEVSIADQPISDFLFNTLFAVSMIITPLYVYKILQVVMMFDTTDLLFNLRVLAVHGDNKFGFLAYSHIINQALFAVAIWKYPKVPLWKILFIVAANLMAQFAIMEKSGILFLFAATLFVLFEKQIIKVRTILVTSAVIVVLFFLINFSKEVKSDETAESMTFIDFFAIYILSPSVAFGKIQEDLSMQFGSHTFQIIYAFLDRWGIGDYEVNTRIQDFVWVPLPTNVYTIFQPFFQDFGYRGVAFFAMLYGTLSGWIYRFYRNGSFTGRCVYAYMLEVLLTQFFSEDLMQNIVQFIQFCVFVFIIAGATNMIHIVPTKQITQKDEAC